MEVIGPMTLGARSQRSGVTHTLLSADLWLLERAKATSGGWMPFDCKSRRSSRRMLRVVAVCDSNPVKIALAPGQFNLVNPLAFLLKIPSSPFLTPPDA